MYAKVTEYTDHYVQAANELCVEEYIETDETQNNGSARADRINAINGEKKNAHHCYLSTDNWMTNRGECHSSFSVRSSKTTGRNKLNAARIIDGTRPSIIAKLVAG